jgi:hypothetical protein
MFQVAVFWDTSPMNLSRLVFYLMAPHYRLFASSTVQWRLLTLKLVPPGKHLSNFVWITFEEHMRLHHHRFSCALIVSAALVPEEWLLCVPALAVFDYNESVTFRTFPDLYNKSHLGQWGHMTKSSPRLNQNCYRHQRCLAHRG